MTDRKYRPNVIFGLGGVALGNEFEFVTDARAEQTLEAAWEAGVRYFDTSPWYGLGLCERRFGHFLHNKPRDEYILSTKVGKLLKASPDNHGMELFPYAGSPNDVVFDYTADGVRRSIEDSLQRLGIDRIDIVFVHDLSPDNKLLPRPWTEEFEVALKGAFPALSKMRDEGIIKGWGVGVNRPEPILRVVSESDPDVCLLASQYSLIDHEYALETLFPVAREQGVAHEGEVPAFDTFFHVCVGNRQEEALTVSHERMGILEGREPHRFGYLRSQQLRRRRPQVFGVVHQPVHPFVPGQRPQISPHAVDNRSSPALPEADS